MRHPMKQNVTDTLLLSCKAYLFASVLLFTFPVQAQDQTVGLMRNDPGAYEGYTLIAPLLHPSVYLINLEGQIVHQWGVSAMFGSTNRLLSDGALFRVSGAPSAWMDVQGRSGRLEIIEWDGTVRWQYDFVADTYMLHHDVVPLPNGNLLGVVWDRQDMDAITSVGYDPANLAENQDEIFSERIVEFKPILPDTIEIVWQWDSWDHLVQDHNPLLSDTYAERISDHPGLIDVNTSVGGDWLHFNALDYNEELDVIAVSASYVDEFWIIDHSPSTEEARGNAGGNFGLGGQLLYRWGNPWMYSAGGEEDQTLHFLHSVLWISDGLPGAGNLLVFENGVGQPEGNYSTVHELVLPYMEDSYGDAIWYAQDLDGSFQDPETAWQFSAPGEFYSDFVSGQQRLPNGNTLIAEGMTGRIFELAAGSNQLIWEYVNPVIQTGPLSQGDPIPPFGPPGSVRLQNAVFRALRYGVDFEGFSDKDLSPIGPIELRTTAEIPERRFELSPSYPNPFRDQVTLSIQVDEPMHIELDVFNILGQKVTTLTNEFHAVGTYNYVFNAEALPPGVYLCRAVTEFHSSTISLIHR
ncbi:MAG: aryl-sulfate sulfotransferase [Bacteroidetes bacterium]|nr:aryl-sulfate sulfotransferase [Bacteroidota bacterium]